mmetsp:Transcript_43946/g.127943  ORF Transcript_43946/g.127943 Transcript_43946/m.127943 type:complete len:107 (+) Transcript_43946:510-830(+)
MVRHTPMVDFEPPTEPVDILPSIPRHPFSAEVIPFLFRLPLSPTMVLPSTRRLPSFVPMPPLTVKEAAFSHFWELTLLRVFKPILDWNKKFSSFLVNTTTDAPTFN